MAARALIVHATNLLVRGYQMISPDRTDPDRKPTNALYALTGALRRAFSFKEPDVAVAIIDQSVDIATLPPMLAEQAGRLEALLSAHGLAIVRSERAIDLVASYVAAAKAGGDDIVVVASDKRLAQLVSEGTWWYDAYKDVRYTPELVRKRFEVGPENVAEWLALVGDDDALGGVKGLGKKSATTLIESFGSVAAAVLASDQVAGRTGNALRAGIDAIAAETAKAVLDTAQALPVPLEKLAYAPPDEGELNRVYRQLGFVEFLGERIEELDVVVCDTVAGVASAIASLGPGPVTLHALIGDPSPPRGILVGLALAKGDAIFYVALAGEGALAGGVEALAPFLSDAGRAKRGHDVKAAVLAFARLGVEVAGIESDSRVLSHLTEPSNWAPHDLTLVARHVLGRALPEEDTIRGVGRRRKAWTELPREKLANYAGQLARASERICEALADTVGGELVAEYLDLSTTLVRMERVGIACDGDDLARAGEDFERIGAELESAIFELAGKVFNLGSTKQLGEVLFAELGLPILRRTKTGWSTANEALERIEHAHPIVSLVMRWRRLRRLTDTWVTSLGASIEADGRVRSSFHPARSFSGRLVNSAPDLGRVPGRTPEMARIRHAFAAPAGRVILSVDYSQLGLFVLAHLTGDPALVEPLRTGADLHVLTASAVLELDVSAIGEDERQLGKIVNFATFAGQGASALGMQLGRDVKEAKEIIARFDRRYAKVRAFQDLQLELASERGYIETIAGRRWPIGGLRSPDIMIRSYAERLARRATHEASVADVSRRGLLLADRALRASRIDAIPLLQVLDEVLFEVAGDVLLEAARIAGQAMRSAFPLLVPLRVGCSAGPNWAELEPLDVEVARGDG